MSFEPFNFTFTPPLTVPSPAPASTTAQSTNPTVIATGSAVGATAGARSNAGIIISRLNDLTAMSQYLQDVIVARTGNTAIEIDPSADPITAKALASIYGTDSPPQFITVSMYDKLLDAHMGALQLEMAVGTDSTIQPNPMQVADLQTVVNTVDKHLTSAALYNNWLPLQLASLKGDSIVFQSWANSLSTYPAYYASQPLASTSLQSSTISASNIDMSSNLYTYQSDAITRFSASYSAIYQSLATASPVEQDLGSIMPMFFQQPLPNMLRIVGTLTALSGLVHKPNMATLQGDLINFSFARLASDTSGMLHSCDQLLSLAVSPVSGNLGPLSEVMSAANQQASILGHVTSGAMTGMSKANASVTGNTTSVLSTPSLGTVSEGLKQLGETLNWGQIQITGGLALLDKSFRQLVERRLNQQNDRQSLVDSQRSVDAILGLSKGVVNEQQSGTLTANATSQQQQDAINRILSSLQTGSNTTFVTSGNQIIANPPDMPPVTEPVQRVLSSAKIITTKGPIQS